MRMLTFFLLFSFNLFSQTTKFESSQGRETPTYHEIIEWWKNLDEKESMVKMLTMGPTDAGYPLHLVIVSGDKNFDLQTQRRRNKQIILINNGIHPGEPDGIDASMLLVRDIVSNKVKLPSNVILAIIPVYNIGGALNRSAFYRVNQNGPAEFGFRGNSQNLDLNRDFIKADAKDSRSFIEIFHYCDPDVFVDNHVSNGADYQHIMTLIASQHNKLGGVMGEFMNQEFEPGLYRLMKDKGYDLVPYVNAFGDSPESGWPEFLDVPRYSSGYASLWHTFAFVPETHMLKSYDLRVKATYDLMRSFIEFCSRNSETIKKLRTATKKSTASQAEFPISWTSDQEKYSEITFKGYEAGRKPSEISGQPRLYYDRSRPYEKKVKFYNYYQTKLSVKKPDAYIIPQGWWKVIEILKLNNIQMRQFKNDTTVKVQVHKITEYKTSPRQFEMHHLNSDVKTIVTEEIIKFRKGDYYITLNQPGNRFLVETLDPRGQDSFFAWNFFDAILGQKEGYSSYAFEETASELLKQQPELKNKLEEKRSTDTAFARNGSAQLNFIYQNSAYYEPAHMRYPVYGVFR